LADRPDRRSGLSARATRTVRLRTADCPHGHGRPSGLGRGLSVKANRTSRSEPRKTDRPRGARGLSAQHTRTVQNLAQPKLEITTDRKRRRARTRITCEELASRGPSATGTRTVRPLRTELKAARPRRSTPPIHHRISQTVEAVEARVWGHDNVKQGCYTPKIFPPNSLNHQESRIL
jgi:hypothetical protein